MRRLICRHKASSRAIFKDGRFFKNLEKSSSILQKARNNNLNMFTSLAVTFLTLAGLESIAARQFVSVSFLTYTYVAL